MIYDFFYSEKLSYDTRLRCDMVDFYYSLYGIKRPFCIPNAEIAAMLKPPKIPRADFKRSSSPIPIKKEKVVEEIIPLSPNLIEERNSSQSDIDAILKAASEEAAMKMNQEDRCEIKVI